MGIKLTVSGTQTVTPQMLASMAVLQCGAQELREYLEEQSYENPMMELQEPEQEFGAREAAVLADRLRWLRGTDRQNRSYYAEPDRESLDQYLPQSQDLSLSAFLKEQILTLEVAPKVRTAMEMAADLLDERGLYTGTAAELSRVARVPLAAAKDALARVRRLEPPGVAAQSIQDALLAQLQTQVPRNPLAERMIAVHFSRLATWSEARLARELGADEEAVHTALETIKQLSPYPSNGFSGQSAAQYITPDVCIASGTEGLTVTAEEQYLPTVRVSSTYLRMLETAQDREVRKYLRQKLRAVEQLITDVDRRKSTVLRCGEVIAARQADFFRGGELRTLTLRDVAEELELHESTISRAVKNKYVQCQRGLYPMTWFFQREAGQNYGVGRRQIQAEMREILAVENPRKPLSDQKIAAELSRRNIVLSRRGVAKYRAELGIPAASGRRRGNDFIE